MPGFTQRLYTQQPGRTQHITIMLALHGSEGKSGSEAERIGFSGLSGFFRILSGLSGFTRILNGLSGFCRPCAVIVCKRVQLLPGARRLSQTIEFSRWSGLARPRQNPFRMQENPLNPLNPLARLGDGRTRSECRRIR